MNKLLDLILIPQDKANHFIWSMLICVIVFSCIVITNNYLSTEVGLYRAAALSALFTFTIGNFKELFDHYTGTGVVSWLDILANVCGIITFVFIVYLVSVL